MPKKDKTMLDNFLAAFQTTATRAGGRQKSDAEAGLAKFGESGEEVARKQRKARRKKGR